MYNVLSTSEKEEDLTKVTKRHDLLERFSARITQLNKACKRAKRNTKSYENNAHVYQWIFLLVIYCNYFVGVINFGKR